MLICQNLVLFILFHTYFTISMSYSTVMRVLIASAIVTIPVCSIQRVRYSVPGERWLLDSRWRVHRSVLHTLWCWGETDESTMHNVTVVEWASSSHATDRHYIESRFLDLGSNRFPALLQVTYPCRMLLLCGNIISVGRDVWHFAWSQCPAPRNQFTRISCADVNINVTIYYFLCRTIEWVLPVMVSARGVDGMDRAVSTSVRYSYNSHL